MTNNLRSRVPRQGGQTAGPRRSVSAVVTVDLSTTDWTRVRHAVAAVLTYIVPKNVSIEITIPDDELVVDAIPGALYEVGHVGNVHIRGGTALLVDKLACRLDPARPRTVRRYDPADPWAPISPYDDEVAG